MNVHCDSGSLSAFNQSVLASTYARRRLQISRDRFHWPTAVRLVLSAMTVGFAVADHVVRETMAVIANEVSVPAFWWHIREIILLRWPHSIHMKQKNTTRTRNIQLFAHRNQTKIRKKASVLDAISDRSLRTPLPRRWDSPRARRTCRFRRRRCRRRSGSRRCKLLGEN